MRQKLVRGLSSGLDNALQGPVERDEVGGVHIGRNPRFVTLQHLALRVDGYVKDGEDLALEERLLGVRQRLGAHRHLGCLVGVERLDEAAAELGVVVVNDGDRRVAQQLTQIGLGIEDAVEQRSQDEKREDAAVGQYAFSFSDAAAT